MIDSVGIYLVSQQISNMWTKENKQHEDHDGPISLTWANRFTYLTRIPRKASSHLLGQKSQEPQSERGY